VVAGFKSCHGFPKHFGNDPEFLNDALQAMGNTHDRLLDLTKEAAYEEPYTTVRLL